MPALPFAPGCHKARLSGNIGTGEFGMLFHYSRPTIADATDAEMNQFALDLALAWGTAITPDWPVEVKLTQVVVEGLNSATDGVGAWGGSIVGASSGHATAAQQAVLFKDTIAARYRGGHPRHYWPAPDDGWLSDPTHLSAAGVSNLGAAELLWETTVNGNGVTLWGAGFARVCVSYFSAHAVRPIPFIRPILGTSIEPMTATQRRRVGR